MLHPVPRLPLWFVLPDKNCKILVVVIDYFKSPHAVVLPGEIYSPLKLDQVGRGPTSINVSYLRKGICDYWHYLTIIDKN